MGGLLTGGLDSADDFAKIKGSGRIGILLGAQNSDHFIRPEATRDMLATVAGRIKAALKGGRKLEQIVADKPTADLDTKWGKGFIGPDKFVEMLWGNLVK